MKRAIVGYHRDDEGHWVARLACGHDQHVRHQPPFIQRPWVTNPGGRTAHLGTTLECLKCQRGEPRDRPAEPERPPMPPDPDATPR
ncbi:MAG: DUF3565 domain-containing protein [Gammaproteobacteria bacterium]|nr:DUF3565 domain-containing protein [Gammaproteobacteria bacterium]